MAKTTQETNLARRKRLREEAMSDMTPELQEVFQKIKPKIERHTRAEIDMAHDFGKLVRELSANERRYGEAAVQQLALALGGQWTLEDLWELRDFANSYTESTVRKFAKSRTAGGNLISLDHLRLIASVRRDERAKWVKHVFQNDLTTTELAAAIREKYAEKRQRRTPTIKAPRGVLSGLLQIRSYSDALGKRVDVWDRHVFGKILKSSPDDCTDELLDQLAQTAEAERETIAHAQHIIDRVEEAKQRVQRVIQLRQARQDGSAGDDVAPTDTSTVEERGGRMSSSQRKKAKQSSAEGKPAEPSANRTPKRTVTKKKTSGNPIRPRPA